MEEITDSVTEIIHSVLFNDMILKQISKYLNQYQLLQCRQVCRFWCQEFSEAPIYHIIPSNSDKMEEFIKYSKHNEEKIINFKYFRNTQNYANLPITQLFYSLSNFTLVKRLDIKVLYITNKLDQILRIVSPTLQHLKLSFVDQKIEDPKIIDFSPFSTFPEIRTVTLYSEYAIRRRIDYCSFLKATRAMYKLDVKLELSDSLQFLESIIEVQPNKLNFFYFNLDLQHRDLNKNVIQLLLTFIKSKAASNLITFKFLGTVLKREQVEEYFCTLAPYFDLHSSFKMNSECELPYIKNCAIMMPINQVFLHFPNLISLHIRHFLKIEKGHIYPTLKKLYCKYLHFSNPEELNSDFKSYFSTTFPNLTSLELQLSIFNCNSFSDFDNFTIWENCTKLINLKISCDFIYDSNITGFKDHYFIKKIKKVKDMKIENYKIETWNKFGPGILNLKMLESLSIISPNISSASFILGFRYLPLLKILEVPFAAIDKRSFKLIAKDFKNLHSLQVPSYTDDRLFKYLKNKRPGLYLYRAD